MSALGSLAIVCGRVLVLQDRDYLIPHFDQARFDAPRINTLEFVGVEEYDSIATSPKRLGKLARCCFGMRQFAVRSAGGLIWISHWAILGKPLAERKCEPWRAYSATRGLNKSWYPMQASNLHALRPRLLRPLRLPIPPTGLCGVHGRDRTVDRRSHIPERYHCATRTIKPGRDGRIRTCGLVHPMHARCQTAPHPVCRWSPQEARTPDPMLPKHVRYQLRYAEKVLVGVAGFEPATSSSRKTRATRLRHTPIE